MVLILNRIFVYKLNTSTTYRDHIKMKYFYVTFNREIGVDEQVIEKGLGELWCGTS
jgi:hypothetical protein